MDRAERADERAGDSGIEGLDWSDTGVGARTPFITRNSRIEVSFSAMKIRRVGGR